MENNCRSCMLLLLLIILKFLVRGCERFVTPGQYRETARVIRQSNSRTVEMPKEKKIKDIGLLLGNRENWRTFIFLIFFQYHGHFLTIVHVKLPAAVQEAMSQHSLGIWPACFYLCFPHGKSRGNGVKSTRR